MADVVEMPKLGFDMAEGTLVRWVKSEGDTVNKGEVLAEIETDKATVEVESPFTGVVHKHLVPKGEIVPVGTPIAVIGAEGEKIDLDALAGVPHVEKVESAVSEEKETVPDRSEKLEQEESADGEFYPDGVKASPLARRMAKEHSLDLTVIRGSGPGGRIVKNDIEAYLSAPSKSVVDTPLAETLATPIASERKPTPIPIFSPVGPPPPDQKFPVNRLRAAIGRRMVEAKQQVPHFYVTHDYDMRKVMNLRSEINAALEGTGEKLSVNDFILKAAALALRQYPNLNASLAGNEIIHHGQVNVGVAVAVDGGLLTVVCRDTDRKSLRQISSEVRTMAGKARDGKVRPDDIEGSTFSVSNLGMFDVDYFTAIINPPEVGILAIGSVLEVPVVEKGEIKIGLRMKATISVDHRVSDGAEAAQYMQALGYYLEEPLRLLI
jgi:pyruvate dehydrogenase E2 component (dihydrolipoamide acetyltransferase)